VIAFRAMLPRDRPFVVASWTRSFRNSRSAGLIQSSHWFRIMDEQVTLALERPDVRTIVAFDPAADPALKADLLGFLTADTAGATPEVYYVYVKEHYRRAGHGRLWEGPGLARRLFAEAGINPAKPLLYVCETDVVGPLRPKIPMARFVPDFGRYPKSERRSRR
jgi:hypothetical protein